MSKFNEGPGAGYTVKVEKFYGKFETSIKRVFINKHQIIADIVQTSHNFEFDATWSGYDWSGEEKDIKGEEFNLECAVEILTDKYNINETIDLFIELFKDMNVYDNFTDYCLKNRIDINNLTIEDIIDRYLDMNPHFLLEKDFKDFVEYNSKNIDLDLVQLVDYEEMIGGGYSHVDMKQLSADAHDMERQADYEYAVMWGNAFLLKSKKLNDLVDDSYNAKDNYDESIEIAEGQELVGNDGKVYLSEKGDIIKQGKVVKEYLSNNYSDEEFLVGYYTSGDKYYKEYFKDKKHRGYSYSTDSGGGGIESDNDLYADIVSTVFFSSYMSKINYKKTEGTILKNKEVAMFYDPKGSWKKFQIFSLDDERYLHNKDILDVVELDLDFNSIMKTCYAYLDSKGAKY